MKYESTILKRLIDTYGVVGNPRYISEIIKEFIVRGKERFPELFTYQADWLAHIDEFGLNPSYTVSYTGQSIYAPNTLERPVKSAILKGNTLVNLLNKSNIKITSNAFIAINYTHNLDTTKTYIIQYRINQIPELTDVTDSGRLFKFEWYNGNISNGHLNIYNKNITVGTNNFIIINPFSAEVTRTNFGVWCPNYVSGNLDMDIMLMEYQNGMENWDIPYFKGMQSVKMPVLTTTGKNLFDGLLEQGYLGDSSGMPNTASSGVHSPNYMRVNPLTTYICSWKTKPSSSVFKAYFYDENKEFLKQTKQSNSFTTPDGCYYVRFRFFGGSPTPSDFENIQLEEGTQATSYEPYKSNILSCLEPVELGSVGEVKDELNLLTGQLTQRTETRPYQESDESDSEVLTDMTNTRYKLAQEVVKTVDLTILDQNGQNVKQLMSFKGGTHFNTRSSEGSLLPLVSVSVETDLEETLKVCSLEGNTM